MKKSRTKTLVILIFLILFSLVLRFPTFYAPHNMGDQIQYLGLAMKLDAQGFAGYNLRGIDLMFTEGGVLFAVRLSEGKGNLLDTIPKYYDSPLFHKPPLFSYALMLSHRIFDMDNAYSAVNLNMGWNTFFEHPKLFLRAQFYCVIVPLFFSIALILGTFFFGRKMFGENAGILASFLMAVTPIELLCAQRVWTDAMAAFLIGAAFVFYFFGRKGRKMPLVLLAGACGGLSALTKPSGHMLLLGVFIFEVYLMINALRKKGSSGVKGFHRYFFVFVLVHVLITLPWHLKVFSNYGSISYFPSMEQAQLRESHPWFKFVFNRPWYMYFVNSLVQTPLLVFAYLSIGTLFRKVSQRTEKEKENIIFLLIWIASFFIAFYATGMSRELRYILPVYPAFAVLAGEYMGSMRRWLDEKYTFRAGTATIALMCVLCGLWSVYVGVNAVLNNQALIVMPF